MMNQHDLDRSTWCRLILNKVFAFIMAVVLAVDGFPAASVAYALDMVEDSWGTSEDVGSTAPDGTSPNQGSTDNDSVSSENESTSSDDVSDKAQEYVDEMSSVEVAKEADPEPERVTFVFDANVAKADAESVSGSMDDFVFVMDGIAHSLPTNAYQREGHEFVSWSLTPDGKDVKDVPETTEIDESFKTLSIADGLSMIDLGYDEVVEKREKDESGNEIVTSKTVARNLDYAVKDGSVRLYAQWRKVPEQKPETVETASDEGATETFSDDGHDEGEAGDADDDDDGDESPKIVGEGGEDESLHMDGNESEVVSSGDADAPKVGDQSMDVVVPVEEDTSDDKPSSDGETGTDGVSAQSEKTPNLDVSVTTGNGVDAVSVHGTLVPDVDGLAQAIMDEGVSSSKAKTMSRRLASAPILRSPAPVDPDLPRSGDGSNVEGISVAWVTEDTVDNGDAALLYVKPEEDTVQTVKMVMNYALSGEHDYDRGDVVITIPDEMIFYRDGKLAGKFNIPFPEDPYSTGDFNWVHDLDAHTYVLTNTVAMSAATKGYIEFSIENLVPHKLVDMATSDPFWAKIEVVTHAGNVIGLVSNEIEAQFDTEASVTHAYKKSSYTARIVSEDAVPAAARVAGETEYVLVDWYMYADVLANTEWTMELTDTKTDTYQGKIVYPSVADGAYSSGSLWGGYESGEDLGYHHVTVAYPMSQFEPDVNYRFQNHVRYDLLEVDPACGSDPQKATFAEADAALTWSWHEPVFKKPTGHFMVNKIGNDGKNPTSTSPYTAHQSVYGWTSLDIYVHNRDDYQGIYPSALNDVRDGDDVEIAYTVESIGYILPWTVDPSGDLKKLSTYGKRPVTMTTWDGDETKPSQLYLSDGTALRLGTDYVYKAVEFPKKPNIGYAAAVNLDENGNFVAIHAGDGTVDYRADHDDSHIPQIRVEAKVSGSWRQVAVVDWTSGNLSLTPYGGALVDGCRLILPAGTEQVRSSVTSTNAYIWYYMRPIFEILDSGVMGDKTEALFDASYVPSISVKNTTYMKAFDSESHEIVDIHKTADDVLSGYATDVAVIPSKSVSQTESDVDRVNRWVTLHYSASFEERTYIPDIKTYEEAVADGRIVSDTQGVFYDLLPEGMYPLESTIALRSGDTIDDIEVIDNYKGSGRALLVVRAHLSPSLQKYSGSGNVNRYMDKLEISFDARYPFDSIRDFGDTPHNVIAYESLAREPLGTVENRGAEADDPRSNNNSATARAFSTDAERDAMTGLDPNVSGERFVYAGVGRKLDMLSEGRNGLTKLVDVNREGRFTTGIYYGHPELNARTVYVGGVYDYEFAVQSGENTISKDIVVYDSLENFYANTITVTGSDAIDEGAAHWHGTFEGVDVSPLVRAGVDPVVYYSTIPSLQLSDETHPNVGIMVNMDLTNRSIWVPATSYAGSLSDVKAIAIDCGKSTTEGERFELQPKDSIGFYIHMRAPSGDAAHDYIEQDGPWGDSAMAYNNAYMLSTTQDATTGVSYPDYFVRKDYTKIGLEEYSILASKMWDDDDDRDGLRTESVTVHLYADGVDTGLTAVAQAPDWTVSFGDMPYANAAGKRIHYHLVEDTPDGYELSVSINADGSYTLHNVHSPEKVRISGTKTWVGEGPIPQSITVNLLADGHLVASKRVTPSDSGAWSYDFGECVKYRDGGEEIVYSVNEVLADPVWVPTFDGFDITNTYHPYADLVIRKSVVGQTSAFANKRFEFTLSLKDEDGVALEGEYAYETSDGRSGNIGHGGVITLAGDEFVVIHDLPHRTVYSVKETEESGYTATITNGSGTLVANSDVEVTCVNTYSARGGINIRANKSLTGRELKRYQFRAELWDENDTLVRTASNSDSGTFTFSALNFTQDDVRSEPYVYTIKETKRTLGGYTFDESVYTVSISVLDNGDGTLTIVPTYKDSDNHELPGPPTFENEYHAEGSVTLKAWKQLKGRALTPGEFSFEILDEDGERVGNVATNDENGEIVFDAIPFDETDVGKTYKYVVHEVAGNDTTVNYSDEAYGYTVIVYDNGDGTLSFAQDTASATVGEPRRLRWDEVPEESRADYIWYDPSWQRFNFWCSFDKWGAVNEDNGYPMPHTEYSDQALARGAAVMSDALNVSVTATDFDTYFGNQVQGPARDLKASAVVRLHDTLVEAFPWFGLYADSHAMTVDFRGINPTGQNSNLVAFNTETVDIDIDDESGTVPVFTNTLKPGSLSIEKHVSDVPDEHSGDTFRFHVKLTGEGSGDIDSLEYVHEQID